MSYSTYIEVLEKRIAERDAENEKLKAEVERLRSGEYGEPGLIPRAAILSRNKTIEDQLTQLAERDQEIVMLDAHNKRHFIEKMEARKERNTQAAQTAAMRAELQLTLEECEGTLAANEWQGGEYNAGGSAVLKEWIADVKSILALDSNSPKG